MRPSKLILSLFSALVFASAATAWSANVVLINLDPPGLGLNDPTPAAPIGGNPGVTIGEQRVNAYLRAADVWGQSLQSDVPIFVGATFQPLPCASGGGVLGAAGPTSVNANFPGATRPLTWHVGALADSLAGFDLAPGSLDIISFFNSDIDDNDPACLTGTSWYYGLDHSNPGNGIDFLAVVMHEINHGLGALELVSESTGAFFHGLPDVYAVNMYDWTLQKSWENLTDMERLYSSANTDNLLWIGNSVSQQAPNFLGPRPSVLVDDPDELEGSYEAQAASFGAPLDEHGEEEDLVLADDGVGVGTDACEAIVNDDEMHGKIALVDRGACAFTTKVANAQAAGAKGVIIANNQPKGRAPMGGFDPAISIPSVGISMALGDALKVAMADDEVEVELALDDHFLAGANESGLVRLYAPDPIRPGSSKSHWDTSASPNLLMEPFITDDLRPTQNLDLSPALLQDTGWVLGNPPLIPGGGDDDHDDDDDDH
jgi:PA domain